MINMNNIVENIIIINDMKNIVISINTRYIIIKNIFDCSIIVLP